MDLYQSNVSFSVFYFILFYFILLFSPLSSFFNPYCAEILLTDHYYNNLILFFVASTDQKLKGHVHEIVGRINGRFGTLTSVPIHHLVIIMADSKHYFLSKFEQWFW